MSCFDIMHTIGIDIRNVLDKAFLQKQKPCASQPKAYILTHLSSVADIPCDNRVGPPAVACTFGYLTDLGPFKKALWNARTRVSTSCHPLLMLTSFPPASFHLFMKHERAPAVDVLSKDGL